MARPRSDARERILEAALRVLREDGVAGFSQPAVAARAGVPQGHLTYYFPKRRDLLHAVAARFSGDAVAEVQKTGDLFRMMRDLVADRERTRVLVGLLVEADADPVLAGALAANTDAVIAALRAQLPHLDDVDAELLLYMLWGVGIRHLTRPDADGARTALLLKRVHETRSPIFARAHARPQTGAPQFQGGAAPRRAARAGADESADESADTTANDAGGIDGRGR